MTLTQQQFVDGLNADQLAFFNAFVIAIRIQFQANYADSVAAVSAAKDQLLIDKTAEWETERAIASTVPALKRERDAALAQSDVLQAQVDTIPSLNQQIAELTAEVERLTASIPPPPSPREITPREFLERISQSDKDAIMDSRDPRCRAAVWTLFTSLSVNLDSPVLVGLIDALVAAGINIDETERARIFA